MLSFCGELSRDQLQIHRAIGLRHPDVIMDIRGRLKAHFGPEVGPVRIRWRILRLHLDDQECILPFLLRPPNEVLQKRGPDAFPRSSLRTAK